MATNLACKPTVHPTKTSPNSPKKHYGFDPSINEEDAIQSKLKQERERLEREAGINHSKIRHFKKPEERPFTKDQRDQTTILIGGLTFAHEYLIKGAWTGLGYTIEVMPAPDVKAFQLGKEYGNNGQCNPTYFTVGNLIKYLQDLEEKGMSREQIINNYVMLTAGACGPCRFGMYEAEYRLALRNAGFDGFRVLIFQQKDGLDQAEAEAGLQMNLDFFLGLLNAFNIGDMLNGLGYQVRPYEKEADVTNNVMKQALDLVHEVLTKRKSFQVNGALKRPLSELKLEEMVNYLGKFMDQWVRKDLEETLRKVKNHFNAIEVDRFRVKPVVKVTGEFWAQITEGDGNYNMFNFLEGEHAEVLVEPIGTWIMYLMAQYKRFIRDRRDVKKYGGKTPGWRLDKKLNSTFRHHKKMMAISLAEKIFYREYSRLQIALGGTLHSLVDQYHLQRVAHPFYNARTGGGEGHMEVAKNIYYHNKGLAHMVLSLKPFGCMPSTQSDGAQAAVVELFKDAIYLPIETSGEGEVNAHSRVQMALGNARVKAKQEFQETLALTGKSLEELKAYVDNHPQLKKALYYVPKKKDIAGTAANFVLHISELMDKERGKNKSSHFASHLHATFYRASIATSAK